MKWGESMSMGLKEVGAEDADTYYDAFADIVRNLTVQKPYQALLMRNV